MRAFVGVTDGDWFKTLSAQPNLDEVNFWQPGGQRRFIALNAGELFLFKLHSPADYIAGGGIFSYSTLLPIRLVWEAFGVKNGAQTISEMRKSVEKHRSKTISPHEDYTIGCILLSQPFFFRRGAWIPVPSDWSRNIVQGKGYNLDMEPGLSLWKAVQERLSGFPGILTVKEGQARFGEPILITPRLGQGSFRVIVTDAYSRRCAVTGERTLPVLEAVHIRPYSQGGFHEVTNGVLFRSDIHTLFDRGFVTVDPEYIFEVSRRIREDFENGRDYYALHGSRLIVPEDPKQRPDRNYLSWHNESVFLG